MWIAGVEARIHSNITGNVSMNIYSIYKATNLINGKIYIGFDSNWPQRMWEHKSPSNYKTGKHKFYRALRKYGINNFHWEVIYQSQDKQHCLTIMEPFFIKEFDSYKCGYNSTLGGEGMFGYKHTSDFFLKKRKPITINGITYTSRSEAKQKLNVCWRSIYKLAKGETIGRFGKRNSQSKPVIIFGKKYDTKTEAKNSLGIGWKLLDKIIQEKLDHIPEESLKKSKNSTKGFLMKKGR